MQDRGRSAKKFKSICKLNERKVMNFKTTFILLFFTRLIGMENLNNMLIEKPATLKLMTAYKIVTAQIEFVPDQLPTELSEFLNQIDTVISLSASNRYGREIKKLLVNLLNKRDFSDDKIAQHFSKLLKILQITCEENFVQRMLDKILLNSKINNSPIEIASLVLSLGANINTQDIDGYTTLILTLVYEANFDLAKILIEKGCNVNCQNKNGNTALIFAALLGDKKLLKILIKAGANINHQNKIGNTALMISTGWSKKEIVKVLLKKGADITITNRSGDSALGFAQYFINHHPETNKEIIEILLKAKEINET